MGAVLAVSMLDTGANWAYCHRQPLCLQRITFNSYQLLICLILTAYLLVIAELFAGNVKSWMAVFLRRMRNLLGKLSNCRNNLVAPVEVEELQLNVHYNVVQDGDSNTRIITMDHIRCFSVSSTFSSFRTSTPSKANLDYYDIRDRISAVVRTFLSIRKYQFG